MLKMTPPPASSIPATAVARFLWMAFVSTILMFAGVLYFLSQSWPPSDGLPMLPLVGGACGLGLVALFIRAKCADQRTTTAVVTQLVVNETIAIVGLAVGANAQHFTSAVPYFATALLLQISLFPQKSG